MHHSRISHASLADALELGIERVPFSGCWLWTRSTRPNGYGQLTFQQRVLKAHRASWEAFRGDIPADKLVLHRCDVKCCINPAHLYLGTKVENARDVLTRQPDRWHRLGPRSY